MGWVGERCGGGWKDRSVKREGGDESIGGRVVFFFFNDTAATEIYTLSLHDALPIYKVRFYSIRAAVVSLSAESVVFITQASVAAGLAVSSGRARCQ